MAYESGRRIGFGYIVFFRFRDMRGAWQGLESDRRIGYARCAAYQNFQCEFSGVRRTAVGWEPDAAA